MTQSDIELRASVERLEKLASLGALLVLAGLIAEACMAEHLTDIAATLAIAGGVGIEILFGKMASLRQGKLLHRSEQRLALALRRTEHRNLKDGKLLDALREHPPASLVIKFLNDDPESYEFAMDFELVFSSLGWKVSWYTESYGDALVTGIRVPERNAEDATAVENVRAALNKAGIEFSTEPTPTAFQSTGPFGVANSSPTVIIYVGPKPTIP